VILEPTPTLAEQLLLPLNWIQEVMQLLIRRRQLVFYGPPGTGKTYVAQRLAAHVTTDGGTYRLVQFHPSYTYEDFFEGFRPRSSLQGSGVTYELVAGPLREMAEAAADDPANPYVLIIDEINRANLAKVFGELYFLLEYRDQATSLLYSQAEDFTLPTNLFFIGTMNTADRSIALVDPAMRRRFYFVGFFPDREPISSLLERWVNREGLSTEAAGLLAALNREIADPDFSIGPSYFMDSRIGDAGELELIWEHAIMPLLTEHFFGTEVSVEQRFSLASLRAARLTELPETTDAAIDSDVEGADA
jgi:5-methylcytosine-specific restriction protein B